MPLDGFCHRPTAFVIEKGRIFLKYLAKELPFPLQVLPEETITESCGRGMSVGLMVHVSELNVVGSVEGMRAAADGTERSIKLGEDPVAVFLTWDGPASLVWRPEGAKKNRHF
ncbi:hypothetical protein FISHEDRAFT_55240 [Fistulina hepatica ATCC 64428]|uniref:Uncharacterized protein n=1 Tax=Fistulina hepatica ATCC 64428 TaxID=1128425 RepID=A0A0D7APY7_9AGAR|nr:hypothetical protein FISHEDRAFT_55240 [Fistulina hepatica ATCC 64428]